MIKKMGQKPQKYHVTDEGEVLRINKDGSFSKMGNVEQLNYETSKEASSVKNPSAKLPIKRTASNYSWMWWTGLVLIFGFVVTAFSCGWPEREWYDAINNTHGYFTVDYTIEISLYGVTLLLVYVSDWIIIRRWAKRVVFIISILSLTLFAIFNYMMPYDWCEERYITIICVLGMIQSVWWLSTIVTLWVKTQSKERSK